MIWAQIEKLSTINFIQILVKFKVQSSNGNQETVNLLDFESICHTADLQSSKL